jgi:hypothetical protein
VLVACAKTVRGCIVQVSNKTTHAMKWVPDRCVIYLVYHARILSQIMEEPATLVCGLRDTFFDFFGHLNGFAPCGARAVCFSG